MIEYNTTEMSPSQLACELGKVPGVYNAVSGQVPILWQFLLQYNWTCRSTILGFHSREKAEIRMETF